MHHTSRFPDGETLSKIAENVRGEEVFVVQPTVTATIYHMMELFIMMDALAAGCERGAHHGVCVYG